MDGSLPSFEERIAYTLDARARGSDRRAGRASQRGQLSLSRAHRRVRSSQGLELRATKDCAHWLNWKCGIDLGAAREKVRTARALEKLPQVSAAMERGEVSYSKVRAITRVATPENEHYFLNIALHGTAHHVETLVRAYRRDGNYGLAMDALMWPRRAVSAETRHRFTGGRT
jgi:hypothetical protein